MGRLIPGFLAASAGEYEPPVNGGPGGGTGGVEYEQDWTTGSTPAGWTVTSGTVTRDATGTYSNVANTFATLNNAMTLIPTVDRRDFIMEINLASYPANTNETYADAQVRNTASGSGTGGTGVTALRVGYGVFNVASFRITPYEGATVTTRARPATAGRMWVAMTFDNISGAHSAWIIKDGEAPVYYSQAYSARAGAANMNTLTIGVKGLTVGDSKLRKSLFRFNSSVVMNETEVISKITSWGYTAP